MPISESARMLARENTMRTMTLQPHYRRPGFAPQLLSRLDLSPTGATASSSHPPYNLEQRDGDHYTLTIAAPGLDQDNLEINIEKNILSIEGRGSDKPEGDFIHQGINCDGFVRRFQLGEHVNVSEATLKNGLLTIQLAREIPEAAKPKVIPISSASNEVKAAKTLDQDTAA
ncbi:MAG TPA: hypothetical protein DCF62_13645 [Porticoccaceae bacterium]|nr:hypothetical protein [Porticoccaceae bacterium]